MESEAFEDLEKGGGALRTVKDLAAGAAGGMAQVLLGIPPPPPRGGILGKSCFN